MKAPVLTVSLLILCELNAFAADTIDNWGSIELGQAGDLTVRLRVKPKASLADEDWLAVEFDNRGKTDIKIDMAQYRIDSDRFDLKTGILVSSGGLASGNDHSLFPDAWKSLPVADRVIAPGVYRMIEHPSLCSSALLGVAPKDGLLIKAEVFMDMRINNELVELDAKKFDFQWLYPETKGFDAMHARLLHLLASPHNAEQHADILHALLAVPELEQAASPQQLLAAIGPRVDSFSGREYILEHLNDHCAGEPIVLDYFFARIVDTDKRITKDLRRVPKIWDSRFLHALLNRFDGRGDSVHDIFVILRQHGTPQQNDSQIAARLSNALLRFGWLDPRKQYAPIIVANSLTLMGHTCDRNMIPQLTPYLDDSRPTIDLTQPGSSVDIRLPPLRVCDHALEAILEILDGSPGKACRAAGFKLPRTTVPGSKDGVEITKIRDKMITTLKQRLAESNVQPKN